MKIKIVAGGPESHIPKLTGYDDSETVWIGVDRGTFVLLSQGIVPQFAFGDFDSVSETEKKKILDSDIQLNIYQSEKDQTDMEIAVQWSLLQNPDGILLFGATGGRLDHELLNIQLLYRSLSSNTDVKIIDFKNEISLKKAGTYSIVKESHFNYVSFLAFSETVKDLTLEGFKYPLKNASLQKGSSLCISNELVKKSGTYSFDSGIIMMIKSRD
jgi:thiamine pyrophosphokinase